MKVDLISEHADPRAALGGADAGGQNVHVTELATALAARGHDVVVYTRRTSPAQPRRAFLAPGASVEYVRAGPAAPLPKDTLLPYMAAFAEELARCWSARPPDLVHAHFWMSGQAALAAAGGDLPVLQTFHALGTVKRRWQGSADTSPACRVAAEREIGERVDAVVATCSDEVRELRAMGVPAERVAVVPCGVDLGLFRPGPAVRRSPGTRVLSIGRLVPRKGVDTLVRALREVPGAELVIAGGGAEDDEAHRLRDLAAAYGLAGRVRVIGSVPRGRVPELMRSADVLVSVPWYEPFGIVPLEAMACGVPVIASGVGGHLDTVAGCGVLVPPRRPQALARALREVLAHPARRRSMGHSGAVRARQGYGWPHVAELTEAVYRSVLRERSGVESLELFGGGPLQDRSVRHGGEQPPAAG